MVELTHGRLAPALFGLAFLIVTFVCQALTAESRRTLDEEKRQALLLASWLAWGAQLVCFVLALYSWFFWVQRLCTY